MQTRKDISLLDNDLQEILSSIKQECLSMATIPYNGTVSRLDTKGTTIIVHSLIPGLEPYQLIRIIRDKVECFLAKGDVSVPISEESILKLMRNVFLKSRDELQKEKNVLIDLDIPEEIIKSTAYLDDSPNSELNNLYEIFATNVAELRQVKKEYVLYEMNTSNVTLHKKQKLNLTDSKKSARILVRERG